MNKLFEKGEKGQPRKWLPSKGAPGVIKCIREKWQTFKYAQNLLKGKKKKKNSELYPHTASILSPHSLLITLYSLLLFSHLPLISHPIKICI